MPNVFEVESFVLAAVGFALLIVKAYALISAVTFEAEAYEAAGKLTKVAWCVILGIGMVVQVLWIHPLQLLNIGFTIAAFVYLADVRPALRSLRRR